MRPDSPTYLQHLEVNISSNLLTSLLIPPMVGNCFYVTSDIALYHYKLSYSGDYIDHDKQYTLAWNDPRLSIDWQNINPILSERDK